jgi:hypothetical protein
VPSSATFQTQSALYGTSVYIRHEQTVAVDLIFDLTLKVVLTEILNEGLELPKCLGHMDNFEI